MSQNISARRGVAIAGFAALVLVVFLAAFDNQWTAGWREGRSASGGDATHSWISGPVRGLSVLAWRATRQSGESSRVFYGTLAEPVIAVVLTFLLVMLVCRGVGARRGRWPLFLGAWFATGLAACAALIAGSGIGGIGIAYGAVDSTGPAQFGRGDIYYTLIVLGLAFGLFAGWLVGFAAVLTYGSTEASAATADAEATTREYPSSAIDYSDYAPPAATASGPSEDYAFSPTSPYPSSDPTPGYSGYEAANAPTEVTTPPQENGPYGGGQAY